MSKITPNFQFLPQESSIGAKTLTKQIDRLPRFARMLQTLWQHLAFVVNGQIGFGDGTNSDNINGVWVPATFGLANTDLTLTHNLGRIPVGYITMTADRATDIYTGSVAATKSQITLRSSVANAVVNFFIL